MNANTHTMYRLDDVITASKTNEMTLQTTSLLSKVSSNVVFAFSNVMDKYKSVIEPQLVKIKLNDDEYKKYKYNPHRLSLDLYGTTELWFMLLKFNKIMTSADFTLYEFYILHPENLETINRILIKESEFIEANRIEIGV